MIELTQYYDMDKTRIIKCNENIIDSIYVTETRGLVYCQIWYGSRLPISTKGNDAFRLLLNNPMFEAYKMFSEFEKNDKNPVLVNKNRIAIFKEF